MQSEAVVRAAAELHGPLVEPSQAGGRLARVEDGGAVGPGGLHHAPRSGGDAAHALHEVEREPFAHEQRVRRAVQRAHERAARHGLPVARRPVERDGVGAEPRGGAGEDACGYGAPGHGARLLGRDGGRGAGAWGDGGGGRHVARGGRGHAGRVGAEVFVERAVEEGVEVVGREVRRQHGASKGRAA